MFTSKTFGSLVIHCFPSGPYATNGYLIVNKNNHHGFLVDAPMQIVDTIRPIVEQQPLQLEALFLTHSHWDHIGDAALLKRQFPALEVIIHKNDSFNLKVPGSDRLPLKFSIEGVTPTLELQGGETLNLVEYEWLVLHTPGHTQGGLCLYQPDYNLLFSGDTLFQGTFGNTSFPFSNHTEMRKSLNALTELPTETIVFPGHGDATTILAERTWILCQTS